MKGRMNMLRFDSDYMEGAHPQILRRLTEMNLEKMPGYGTDEICNSAKEKIRAACSAPEADIFFLVGGTQTNATAIHILLRPFEGVISAVSGHINVHEAGAIECGGHKVIPLPAHEGKLDAADVEAYLAAFYRDDTWTHMVKPGMVYISQSTEYGTIYTKAELKALHEVCAKYNIPLFLDGARLGYALTAPGTDVTLATIAEYCDAFYIGGTKVGALFGEALVFPRRHVEGLVTMVKQMGALLAKGWLLGVQFDELFTNDLYMEGSRNAIAMAERLKAGLKEKGYVFFIDSPTNQQFVILDNARMEKLKENASFSFIQEYGSTHTVVRFATSWATTPAQVDALLALL